MHVAAAPSFVSGADLIVKRLKLRPVSAASKQQLAMENRPIMENQVCISAQKGYVWLLV